MSEPPPVLIRTTPGKNKQSFPWYLAGAGSGWAEAWWQQGGVSVYKLAQCRTVPKLIMAHDVT